MDLLYAVEGDGIAAIKLSTDFQAPPNQCALYSSYSLFVNPIPSQSPTPSVSPSSTGSPPTQCLSRSSRILTDGGSSVALSSVTPGMRVLAAKGDINGSASLHNSDIYAIVHEDESTATDFVRVTASSGHSIALTPGHYIPISRAGCSASSASSSWEYLRASDVRAGHGIWVTSGKLVCAVVTDVAMEQQAGFISPMSVSGNLVVDGVLVSAYADGILDPIAR